MFTSTPPICTGRALELSRKDSNIRYLRHLGNSDIALKSNHPDYAEGAVVNGLGTWADYQIETPETMSPMGELGSIATVDGFSTFAIVGPTAYIGLLDVGEPKAGETVVVSAAAGAVGSIVGQIAKIKGCRVVGLTGTAEKCTWIKEDLGFDVAINYRGLSGFPNAILGPFGVFRE